MSDWNLDPLVRRLKKRGVLPQREHIHAKRKAKVDKPWRVYWRWRRFTDEALLPLNRDRHCRKFATEAQALAYIEKEKRSTSCHPSTGKRWGPTDWWVEGPPC